MQTVISINIIISKISKKIASSSLSLEIAHMAAQKCNMSTNCALASACSNARFIQIIVLIRNFG